MLAPHHAENAKLGIAWFASQQRNDFLIFRGRELMLCDQLGCDGHLVSAGTADNIDSKMPRPSVDPMSGSQARSGCGIMPITLRSRLSTPAMLRIEPFGLS